MTDEQDLILDKLVGSKIGVNWPDGPLAIAASMLDGDEPIQFGVTDNDRGAKTEIARRLGLPVLLCEAIQGAVRGLKAEEDRRSFAMLVFRSVVIPGKPKKMSSQEQNFLAGAIAVQVHPILCREDCPAVLALQRAMIDPPDTWASYRTDTSVECSFARMPIEQGTWVKSASPPPLRLVQTLYQVIHGLYQGKSMGGWCSIRESARLMASECGVGEAAKLCVEIARRCGLTAEAV